MVRKTDLTNFHRSRGAGEKKQRAQGAPARCPHRLPRLLFDFFARGPTDRLPAGGDGMIFLRPLRNIAVGAVLGALAVFFAARDGGQGTGIHWEWSLYGAGAGAVAGLLATLVPRLLRGPKDWPTLDEFRRGARRSRKPDAP